MKVNFVGDIGIFKKYEVLGIDPVQHVVLPESDLTIGNFEFIVANNRAKFFYDVRENYSCSAAFFETVNIGRFDGLGMANNHSLDYGFEGAEDTMTLLRKKGVTVFGFSTGTGFTTGVFEKQGIRLSIIACVKAGRWSKEKHGFGPDSYDPEKICREIAVQRKTSDHVVVFPHWGTELIEIPDQEDIENARQFIDSGASAVIGHHPHISQGIETYSNGLIAYSLGSFIYIPEEELGYSKKNINREISICLTVNFSKNRITAFNPSYYRYDAETKVPVLQSGSFVENYANFLNKNISNRDSYRKQLRSVLLKREWRSFLLRFREKPFATVYAYIGFLNPKKIKKLFSS